MRILLVKTSSLGDVIHNLPVASDIKRHFPEANIDWCVEEAFAAIPRLHPGIDRIIPVAIRRWRKSLFSSQTWAEIRAFRRELQGEDYDLVLDTQGLMKSALVARQARGPVAGYAPEAAREPTAARFYQHTYGIPKGVHAVDRNRWLAAAAFGYDNDAPLDYGIASPPLDTNWLPPSPYAVLLTATSRDDKLWCEEHWITLGRALAERGVRSVLPAGSPTERDRAVRLAGSVPGAVAAPPLGLDLLAALLSGARLAVGVDTGLSHLAAALKTPIVALYTATEPGLTGVVGTGFCRNLGGTGRPPEPAAVIDMLQTLLP